MLQSKCWQSQVFVTDGAKMFMSILIVVSLFIYQIYKFFVHKWSVKIVLQSLKGENVRRNRVEGQV
jgi:hypothetical protein